jgi:TusA-related sulfurtransferase
MSLSSEPARDEHKLTLDCRGMMCPEPIRRAQEHALALAGGGLVTVQATDPAAAIDFEAWCAQRNFPWHGCEDRGDWMQIRYRVPAGVQSSSNSGS